MIIISLNERTEVLFINIDGATYLLYSIVLLSDDLINRTLSNCTT